MPRQTDPLRFSRLKLMSRSPMHFAAWEELEKDTLAMRLGWLTHAIVLGVNEYAVYEGTRRGKAWEAFEANQPASARIFTASEFDAASPMATAVRGHDEAMRLLTGGAAEETIRWTESGVDCRTTPDMRHAESVVELKTARCSEPSRFNRDGLRLAYHAQLAWQIEGIVKSRTGTPRDAFIVAVESAPPHPVTVLRLTERALEQGARLCRLWFERMLVHRDLDLWPGYCEAIVPFDVPDDDVELTFGEESAA